LCGEIYNYVPEEFFLDDFESDDEEEIALSILESKQDDDQMYWLDEAGGAGGSQSDDATGGEESEEEVEGEGEEQKSQYVKVAERLLDWQVREGFRLAGSQGDYYIPQDLVDLILEYEEEKKRGEGEEERGEGEEVEGEGEGEEERGEGEEVEGEGEESEEEESEEEEREEEERGEGEMKGAKRREGEEERGEGEREEVEGEEVEGEGEESEEEESEEEESEGEERGEGEESEEKREIKNIKRRIIQEHTSLLNKFREEKIEARGIKISKYRLYDSYVKCLKGETEELFKILEDLHTLGENVKYDNDSKFRELLNDLYANINLKDRCFELVNQVERKLFGIHTKIPRIGEIESIDNIGIDKAVGYVQTFLLTPDYIERYGGPDYMITCWEESKKEEEGNNIFPCHVYITHLPTLEKFIELNSEIYEELSKYHVTNALELIQHYMYNWNHKQNLEYDFIRALFGEKGINSINYPKNK